MHFSRKQLIILFGLLVTVVVLGILLAQAFVPEPETTIDLTKPPETTVDKINNSFIDAARETGTLDDLQEVLDLGEDQKKELAVEKRQQNANGVDFVNTDNYVNVGQGLELYAGSLKDLISFQPGTNGAFNDNFVRSMEDGSRLFLFEGDLSEAPSISTVPVMKVNDQKNFSSILYLEKDEVFTLLGHDIRTVFDFTIDEETYWITFIEGETGFENIYVSLPYFENIEQLKGLSLESDELTKDGEVLIINSLAETGQIDQPLVLIEEELDIRKVVKSPIRQDYSDFLTER